MVALAKVVDDAERALAASHRASAILAAIAALFAGAEIALAARRELFGATLAALVAGACATQAFAGFALATRRGWLALAAIGAAVGLGAYGASAAARDASRCEHGDDAACIRSADARIASDGVRFRDDALALLDRACDRGSGRACARAAEVASVFADRAARYADRACEAGTLSACVDAGIAYRKGNGVPLDLDRARDRFERACARDDAQGCFYLGLLYDNGEGVRADATRARQLYLRSCDGKEPSACNNLGLMLERDDPTEAARYYDRGCAARGGLACKNLADLYAKGKGVPEDAQKAIALRQRACEYGERSACPSPRRGTP
jgi:TPR repeat protein